MSCSEFEARPVDSAVATQPLLQEPRRVTAHYAAGDSEEDSGKVRVLRGGRGGRQVQGQWPTRFVHCSTVRYIAVQCQCSAAQYTVTL